jgi:hypothetical protein
MEQQLMLDIVLNLEDEAQLDINNLKLHVAAAAKQITGDDNYEAAKNSLIAQCVKKKPAPQSAKKDETSAANTPSKPEQKTEAKEPAGERR